MNIATSSGNANQVACRYLPQQVMFVDRLQASEWTLRWHVLYQAGIFYNCHITGFVRMAMSDPTELNPDI